MSSRRALRLAIWGLLISAFSCRTTGTPETPLPKDACRTRYPIILVHGIAMRDAGIQVYSFDRIAATLREAGAMVLEPNPPAFGTHQDNAKHLKRYIQGYMSTHPGVKKFNIIAHSKGGLEARYMISRLGMAPYIATLTTIATPHRGSAIADKLLENRMPHDPDFLVWLFNLYGTLLGDEDPDAYQAGHQLTRRYMEDFNAAVPDSPGVSYRSYAARINEEYPHPFGRLLYEIMAEEEGPNDGLVSVRSAQWGDFRGILGSPETGLQVSHADVIDMGGVTGADDFKAPAFFCEIACALKQEGY